MTKSKSWTWEELRNVLPHQLSKLSLQESSLQKLIDVVKDGIDGVALMVACLVLFSYDVPLDEGIVLDSKNLFDSPIIIEDLTEMAL